MSTAISDLEEAAARLQQAADSCGSAAACMGSVSEKLADRAREMFTRLDALQSDVMKALDALDGAGA